MANVVMGSKNVGGLSTRGRLPQKGVSPSVSSKRVTHAGATIDGSVLHTLPTLGQSGAVPFGDRDLEVVTTTDSDSGVASHIATSSAVVGLIADSVSGAPSSSGVRAAEVENTADASNVVAAAHTISGVAGSISSRIVDLGVPSDLSGVRASDDDSSADAFIDAADYARTGIAVANIGPIAGSDAFKAADIARNGVAVSNIGPIADSSSSI